mmetsp:Transcript_20530/g.64529  ORF Transcript_20530/g.64529 Transcript_20530/m.64529 type:complete len:507 (-) Transcript_20530:37-1557(-)
MECPPSSAKSARRCKPDHDILHARGWGSAGAGLLVRAGVLAAGEQQTLQLAARELAGGGEWQRVHKVVALRPHRRRHLAPRQPPERRAKRGRRARGLQAGRRHAEGDEAAAEAGGGSAADQAVGGRHQPVLDLRQLDAVAAYLDLVVAAAEKRQATFALPRKVTRQVGAAKGWVLHEPPGGELRPPRVALAHLGPSDHQLSDLPAGHLLQAARQRLLAVALAARGDDEESISRQGVADEAGGIAGAHGPRGIVHAALGHAVRVPEPKAARRPPCPGLQHRRRCGLSPQGHRSQPRQGSRLLVPRAAHRREERGRAAEVRGPGRREQRPELREQGRPGRVGGAPARGPGREEVPEGGVEGVGGGDEADGALCHGVDAVPRGAVARESRMRHDAALRPARGPGGEEHVRDRARRRLLLPLHTPEAAPGCWSPRCRRLRVHELAGQEQARGHHSSRRTRLDGCGRRCNENLRNGPVLRHRQRQLRVLKDACEPRGGVAGVEGDHRGARQ